MWMTRSEKENLMMGREIRVLICSTHLQDSFVELICSTHLAVTTGSNDGPNFPQKIPGRERNGYATVKTTICDLWPKLTTVSCPLIDRNKKMTTGHWSLTSIVLSTSWVNKGECSIQFIHHLLGKYCMWQWPGHCHVSQSQRVNLPLWWTIINHS